MLVAAWICTHLNSITRLNLHFIMVIAQETVEALSKINNGFGLVDGTTALREKSTVCDSYPGQKLNRVGSTYPETSVLP